MIEILEGTKETVAYQGKLGMRIYLNRETEDYPIHWHTDAELIMPLTNIYTAIVNDTRHVLHPGDILIIPPGELHELFAPESGERMILQFDYCLLRNMEGFDSALHLLRPCFLVTSKDNEEPHRQLRTLLLDMMQAYFSESSFKEAAAYAMLIQFFVILGRTVLNDGNRFLRTNSRKPLKYIEKFLKVCNYIHEHCTEEISVDDLAEMAGFSKFHFSRLFQQFTGVSYYTYLNQHRIMRAERLLIDPSLTVTEVAMQAGFGSLSTFNRVFKTYKKCTPTEYKDLQGCHRHRHP